MLLGRCSRLDAYEIMHPPGAVSVGDVWLSTGLRVGREVVLKPTREE
jgi:hypothetical protein